MIPLWFFDHIRDSTCRLHSTSQKLLPVCCPICGEDIRVDTMVQDFIIHKPEIAEPQVLEYPGRYCVCNITKPVMIEEHPQLEDILSNFKGRRVGIYVTDLGKI